MTVSELIAFLSTFDADAEVVTPDYMPITFVSLDSDGDASLVVISDADENEEEDFNLL